LLVLHQGNLDDLPSDLAEQVIKTRDAVLQYAVFRARQTELWEPIETT